MTYPSSHGLTGSNACHTTSYSSSVSNHSISTSPLIKSVIPIPSFSSSPLKISLISKLLIQGIVFSNLIYSFLSLIPPLLASVKHTYIVSVILSLSEIMPSCSRCIKKGFTYVVIASPFSRQPLSYAKCTKANMRSLCNVHSVSDSECTHPMHL